MPVGAVAVQQRDARPGLLGQGGRDERQHRGDAATPPRPRRGAAPPSGRVGQVNEPSGVITSSSSPDRSESLSQVDIRPPATRGRRDPQPSRCARPRCATGRSSTTGARPRRRWWPAASGADRARSGTPRAARSGTSKVTATASSVSRSTARDAQRVEPRGGADVSARAGEQVHQSERLEVVEGLAAARQRRSALQAVEPNRASSRCRRCPHCGQAGDAAEPTGPPARRQRRCGAGGAIPNAAARSRPRRSSSPSSTPGSGVRHDLACAAGRGGDVADVGPITSMAGQPE